MVGGHPLDLPGADEVGARIADVRDGDLVVAKNGGQQRGGHAALFLGGLKNSRGRFVENPADGIIGGGFRLGFLENFQRGFRRQAAGDVTVAFAAHTIGQNGDAADRLQLLKIFRLPKSDEIFVVVANGSDAGKLGNI
jgi:hypothetical protein